MTNEERGARVWPYADRYAAENGLEHEDLTSVIADMITDLLHLADDQAGGAESVLAVAIDNYEEELAHP